TVFPYTTLFRSLTQSPSHRRYRPRRHSLRRLSRECLARWWAISSVLFLNSYMSSARSTSLRRCPARRNSAHSRGFFGCARILLGETWSLEGFWWYERT